MNDALRDDLNKRTNKARLSKGMSQYSKNFIDDLKNGFELTANPTLAII